MAKEIINTENAPKPQGPYSQAVKSGGFIYVAGQIPIDMTTGIVSQEGVHKETRIIFSNMKSILEAAGSSLDKVIKLTVFLKDIGDTKFVNEVINEYMGETGLPARSVVEVSNLPKNIKIEIDAIAEA